MRSYVKSTALALVLLWLTLSAGCASNAPQTRSFQSMDTVMQLTVYGDESTTAAIEERITELDKKLSSTDVNSEIYRLNRDGSATLDELTADALEQSLSCCEASKGALDITVYPVVCEWGFISGDHHIPSQSTLNRLLKSVDYRRVKLSENTAELPKGTQIDLGATAKGFAADEARKLLLRDGCESAVLNLGGTVLAHGKKPDGSEWRIGIADPGNSADYMGTVSCADKITATSGSYERYFTGSDGKRYCHIIDPKSGMPADNGVESVTVISDSGVKSDSLSTALFVMGLDKATDYRRQHRDFELVILTSDKKALITPALAQSFQLKNEQYSKEVIRDW